MPVTIKVTCTAHHRGEETPVSFSVGEARRTVTDIRDAWLAPDHRYFKLVADDGGLYILRHDTNSQEWELVFYSLPQNPQNQSPEGLSGRS